MSGFRNSLRRQGGPPWKLETAALCPSFLGSKHSGLYVWLKICL